MKRLLRQTIGFLEGLVFCLIFVPCLVPAPVSSEVVTSKSHEIGIV
jgi:hypothetical protein